MRTCGRDAAAAPGRTVRTEAVVDRRRQDRRGPRPRASGQEADELPDEDEALLELPEVLLAPDAAEEEAGFEAAGAVEDFPPERESVR